MRTSFLAFSTALKHAEMDHIAFLEPSPSTLRNVRDRLVISVQSGPPARTGPKRSVRTTLSLSRLEVKNAYRAKPGNFASQELSLRNAH